MTMGNLINHLDVSELFWVEVGGVGVFLRRGSRLTSVNEASQRLGEETRLDCQSFQLSSLQIFLPCVATPLFCAFFLPLARRGTISLLARSSCRGFVDFDAAPD